MGRESKTISRTELYNQVWEIPMMNLAKQYGLSDVGLAKICKKHNIPRPPRGYWARKAGGYNMKRLPLPKGDDVAIEISPSIRSEGVYKVKDSLAGMWCFSVSSRDQRFFPSAFSLEMGNPAACRASRSRYSVRGWHSRSSASSAADLPLLEVIRVWMIFHCLASWSPLGIAPILRRPIGSQKDLQHLALIAKKVAINAISCYLCCPDGLLDYTGTE